MRLLTPLALCPPLLLASCAKPILPAASDPLPAIVEKIAKAKIKAPPNAICSQIKSWFDDEFAINGRPRNMGKAAHNGFDIKAPIGTQVIAAAPGVVVLSSYLHTSGNVVWIDHGLDAEGNRIYSFSAHLSALGVRRGDVVRRGDAIGLSGDSGAGVGTEGPHLHFGVTMRRALLVLHEIDPSDIPSLVKTESVSPNFFLYPFRDARVLLDLLDYFPAWQQGKDYGDSDWDVKKLLTGFTFPIHCKG